MKILSALDLSVTIVDNKRAYIDTWCIVDANDTLIGHSIDTLIKNLANRLVYMQDINIETSYLINYFLDNNFKYVEDTTELKKFRKNNKNDTITNWWNILRSPKGTIYKLEFCCNGLDCEIRSSRAIILSSVKDIVEDWGLRSSVELSMYKSDDMIQTYNRGTSEQDILAITWFTEDLYKIVNKVRKKGCQLTTASNAQKDWIKRDKGKFQLINYKLDDKIDKDIRKAYRGGLVWNKQDTLEIDLGHGYILDMNSIYGYVQKNFRLPCGEPIHIEYEADVQKDEFMFAKYTITASIKEDGIPCISDKSGQLSLTDECLDYMEDLAIWLSQYDLEMLFDNYDVKECVFQEGYIFDTVEGLFDNFIDHWYPIKKGAHGVDRNIAKGYFTTAYGSIGKKTITEYVPVVKNHELHWCAKVDDSNTIVRKVPKFRYVPVPAAITSIARWLISKKARECMRYGLVCAVDTDAIHIICDDIPSCINLGPELGQFKIEAEFDVIRHLGPKQYGYVKDDTVEYKISGASERVKENIVWGSFHKGYMIRSCKAYPVALEGGNIRVYRDYTL